jgi:hypothetical protein
VAPDPDPEQSILMFRAFGPPTLAFVILVSAVILSGAWHPQAAISCHVEVKK